MEHWDKVFEEVPASFEARIVSTLASLEEKPKIRRFRLPGGLIAAALAIVVLGGTAFATDLFGLRNLTSADVVSRSAADGSLSEGTYSLYSVYSPEMGKELESIASSYGLRLHTFRQDFYSENELCSLAGIPPFISNCTAISGYIYEDGSFQGDGTNTAGRFYEYQFGRYRKGSFSEVTLNIGSAGDYEEWIYTTASGVDVQLSMGPDRCVMLADLPGSFVAVNLLGGTSGNSMFMPDPVTREDLQAFADMFDLSALS